MKPLTITTKPLPGETTPQVWIVQPYAHFSVERGRLGDSYQAQKHLDQYKDTLPEIRLYPVIPGEEVGELIAPVTRGHRPYVSSSKGLQDPVAPFVLRKRALPECWMEYNHRPTWPAEHRHYIRAATGYGNTLTPGQSDALRDAFGQELIEGVQALAPEILRRIRQQVADELRKQAAEARKEADKAEAFAATINH